MYMLCSAHSVSMSVGAGKWHDRYDGWRLKVLSETAGPSILAAHAHVHCACNQAIVHNFSEGVYISVHILLKHTCSYGELCTVVFLSSSNRPCSYFVSDSGHLDVWGELAGCKRLSNPLGNVLATELYMCVLRIAASGTYHTSQGWASTCPLHTNLCYMYMHVYKYI